MSAAARVVVIGAGPYGLATAAYMKSRGVSPRVFGEPMSSWREQMPAGMLLKSPPSASNIPAFRRGYSLTDFCRATGRDPIYGHHPVPVEVFSEYGRWVASRLIPQIERDPVTRIDRGRDAFTIGLQSGEVFDAKSIVIATGVGEFAHIPPELAALIEDGEPSHRLLAHTSEHHDLSRFAGRSVVVIGAGQSALETAVLLREQDVDVRLLVRKPEIIFNGVPENLERRGLGTLRKPESPLGPGWNVFRYSYFPWLFRPLPQRTRLRLIKTTLGPAGAWWLRERFEGIEVEVGARVTTVARDGDRAKLTIEDAAGSRSLTVDHIIAATGYQVDLDRLAFVAPQLRTAIKTDRGFPRLDSSFQSSVPGLFFVGQTAAATFGPVMRFVAGAGFAARRAGRAATR